VGRTLEMSTHLIMTSIPRALQQDHA